MAAVGTRDLVLAAQHRIPVQSHVPVSLEVAAAGTRIPVQSHVTLSLEVAAQGQRNTNPSFGNNPRCMDGFHTDFF